MHCTFMKILRPNKINDISVCTSQSQAPISAPSPETHPRLRTSIQAALKSISPASSLVLRDLIQSDNISDNIGDHSVVASNLLHAYQMCGQPARVYNLNKQLCRKPCNPNELWRIFNSTWEHNSGWIHWQNYSVALPSTRRDLNTFRRLNEISSGFSQCC